MAAAAGVSVAPFQWAQLNDYVLVKVPLQDAKDVSITIPEGKSLHVKCVAEGKTYEHNLPLYADVIPEESSNVTRARQIEIKLKKKVDASVDEDASFWPRLATTSSSSITSRWPDSS